MKTPSFFKWLFTACVILISAIVISPSIIQASAEQSTTSTVSTENTLTTVKARVSLKSPVSVSETVKLASDKGLQIEMVEGDFVVGSTSLYDWYFVQSGMDDKAIEKDYTKSRLAYLESLLEEEKKLSTEQRDALKNQYADIKVALEKKDIGAIVIKKLTLSGGEEAINSLSQNNHVDQVNIIKEQPKQDTVPTPLQELQNRIERGTPKNDKQTQSVVSAAAITQTLPSAPRIGMSDTKTSTQYSGQRESIQYML